MVMKPNAMVTVTREHDSEALEFVLRVDGERLGSLDYTLPDAAVMRIEYVEVGRNCAALAWARSWSPPPSTGRARTTARSFPSAATRAR